MAHRIDARPLVSSHPLLESRRRERLRDLVQHRARWWRSPALVLVAAAGAAVVALRLPAQLGFEPQPVLGLALVLSAAIAALLPGHHRKVIVARACGTIGLWAAVLWCVLSQPIFAPQTIISTMSQRAAPVLLLASIWALVRLPRAWQRRTTVALAAPTLLALTFNGWIIAPQVRAFQPQYLAIDRHHTLYVSDRDSLVIRVFGPDGSLRAKLWPGLANRQGPPGPGFAAASPFGDPDRLGISLVGRVQTHFSPAEATGFPACGLAVDADDHLYVPDAKDGVMLRFGADGHLQARWSLPMSFVPATGCVATAAHDVYLADALGTITRFSADGAPLGQWRAPDAVGGVSASPDAGRIFVLSGASIDASTGQVTARIHVLTADLHEVTSWTLPHASGSILALSAERIVSDDHGDQRLQVYCVGGRLCGEASEPGAASARSFELGGLAVDRAGYVYATDYGNRVVASFTPTGHLAGVTWSAEDDEPV